jgi:hypothetical protein
LGVENINHLLPLSLLVIPVCVLDMDTGVDPTAGEFDASAMGGSFDCKRSGMKVLKRST